MAILQLPLAPPAAAAWLQSLKRQFGIDRIDVALIGHFHDDHVSGVPMLQRSRHTQCWVPENFADLLRYPEAHKFPCNWPEAARIDKVLPLGREFKWEEYTLRVEPMSGHTRFSVAILFEADGKRFAHTGDQYFFQNRVSPKTTTGQRPRSCRITSTRTARSSRAIARARGC